MPRGVSRGSALAMAPAVSGQGLQVEQHLFVSGGNPHVHGRPDAAGRNGKS